MITLPINTTTKNDKIMTARECLSFNKTYSRNFLSICNSSSQLEYNFKLNTVKTKWILKLKNNKFQYYFYCKVEEVIRATCINITIILDIASLIMQNCLDKLKMTDSADCPLNIPEWSSCCIADRRQHLSSIVICKMLPLLIHSLKYLLSIFGARFHLYLLLMTFSNRPL